MIWTTIVGQGTFPPGNTSLVTEYDPVAADQGLSPFIIYATTTGNGVCPAAVDSAIIEIRTTPIINGLNDVIVCANEPMPIALSATYTDALSVEWSSTGGGLFTNPTDNTPINANTGYTISGVDVNLGGGTIYLTTTNNGLCPAVVDSLILTVTPTPTIEAGPNDTICADHDTINLNASVTIAGGVAWTTNGRSSYA